jgi:hypothetical protein
MDQSWQALKSGSMKISNQTLDGLVQSDVQKAVAKQGKSAYGISDSFASKGSYSASLDTSGANPALHIQYQLTGSTLDFSVPGPFHWLGDWTDPTFHVAYDLTIHVYLSWSPDLTTQSTVTASASADVGNVSVTSHNVVLWLAHLFGDNSVQDVANDMSGQSQDLSAMVPTGAMNALLQGEVAKGYTHLHTGLDASSNLLLTAQKPDLVINGTDSDHIVINAGGRAVGAGSVQIKAGGQWVQFDPGYLHTITVDCGMGQTSVQIWGVPAGVSVRVNSLASSHDTVTVGDGSLEFIAGPVEVNGGGNTALRIDDYKDSSGNATVTDHSVSFAGVPTISYGDVGSLDVVGASGKNLITVNSVNSSIPVTIWNGIHNAVTGPAKSKVVVNAGLPIWA